MLPYQFNKVYTQLTGEYENSLRMLFVPDTRNDILVYDGGSFYIVNKPLQLNLNSYSLDLLTTKKPASYNILQISSYWESRNTYLKLEGIIIKTFWAFSTHDGQQVETYNYCDQKQTSATYEEWLKEMAISNPENISDLRFV